MKKPILIAIGSLLLAGTMAASAQIHIRIGPPARPHEVIGVAPHPGWVWQPGYHRWEGDHYVWVGGSWAEPPHPHAGWVPGHWDRVHGEYVWREGHWR
jgi:WXXGXW repeat (2 copies)